MTWQDELVELETKLASGALSAEEYRRARDELLAQSQSAPAQSAPAQSAPPESLPAVERPASSLQPAPGVQPGAPATQQPATQQPAAQQPAAEPQQEQQPQVPQGQQSPQQYPAQQPRPQGPGPFPPPFQWGQSAQHAPPGQQKQPGQQGQGNKSAQVSRGVGQEGLPRAGGERTQVVRDDDPDRTQTVADPDRTQTVSGVGRQSGRPEARGGMPGGRARDERPRDDRPRDDEDEAPPWAGADSAPVIAPSATWMKQGPESFEAEPARRGRLVGTVVAGVLVVALAVVGISYFTSTDSSTKDQGIPDNGPPAAQVHPTQESSTSSAPPPLPEPPPQKKEPPNSSAALVKPPGKVRAGGGGLKPGELGSRSLFADPIVQALDRAGFSGGVLEPTTNGRTTIGVFALSVRSTRDAKHVVEAYRDVQNSGGVPQRREESMHGVSVFANSDDETGNDHVRRAIYVLYRRVIIVDVVGPDLDEVKSTFTTLLDRQVRMAPPTLRDMP